LTPLQAPWAARLLVVTDSDPDDGTKELVGLDLGGSPDLDGDGFGDQQVFSIQSGLPGVVGAVTAGPDDLRLVALTGAGDLAVPAVANLKVLRGSSFRGHRREDLRCASRSQAPPSQGGIAGQGFRVAMDVPEKK